MNGYNYFSFIANNCPSWNKELSVISPTLFGCSMPGVMYGCTGRTNQAKTLAGKRLILAVLTKSAKIVSLVKVLKDDKHCMNMVGSTASYKCHLCSFKVSVVI